MFSRIAYVVFSDQSIQVKTFKCKGNNGSASRAMCNSYEQEGSANKYDPYLEHRASRDQHMVGCGTRHIQAFSMHGTYLSSMPAQGIGIC
jgi:hypothetical protein